MNHFWKILGDFAGLCRICGVNVACRWLLAIPFNAKAIFAKGDLQPADIAMGEGPFTVSLRGHRGRFRVAGQRAISGIREMYVRDVYLQHGWLRIRDGDTVIDLGANMGNFTNMALAMGPTVQVFAIEPNEECIRQFTRSVDLNPGHPQRVRLLRAFVGRQGDWQKASVSANPGCVGAPWMTEDELIEQLGIQRIDFLKCDIEGGEFTLLQPGSRLLAMANSFAAELHAFAGDVEGFISQLKASGFEIGPTQRDPDGSATVLARRVTTR